MTYKEARKLGSLISKENLYDLYVIQNKSTRDIAIELGFKSKGTVVRLLRKFKITKTNFRLTEKRKACAAKQRKGFGFISGSFWCQIRNNARIRKLAFDIKIEEAWEIFQKQKGFCALSGIPLVMVESRKDVIEKILEQTASLDRIKSSEGYSKENVQWIHKDIQKMKWDLQESKFFYYCRLIINKYEKNK